MQNFLDARSLNPLNPLTLNFSLKAMAALRPPEANRKAVVSLLWTASCFLRGADALELQVGFGSITIGGEVGGGRGEMSTPTPTGRARDDHDRSPY